MRWIVIKKPDPGGMEMYRVRGTKEPSYCIGRDVWVSRRGHGIVSDVRCAGCSSILCGMSGSCAHVKAVRRFLGKKS